MDRQTIVKKKEQNRKDQNPHLFLNDSNSNSRFAVPSQRQHRKIQQGSLRVQFDGPFFVFLTFLLSDPQLPERQSTASPYVVYQSLRRDFFFSSAAGRILDTNNSGRGRRKGKGKIGDCQSNTIVCERKIAEAVVEEKGAISFRLRTALNSGVKKKKKSGLLSLLLVRNRVRVFGKGKTACRPLATGILSGYKEALFCVD
ncbi:uncharacterized protein BDCG_02233 [Blastomyces dermatitidis ER-3]|uniref:Uncharacterized protein n=1 Tax=Ajellomyces dermatitidis (strain ER-3 / ATCC MYA-2586) TaxID=559297 RepID=A0ABP2EUD5_AJEDR|nr:uncharacterized protein BDCG_02233 [Blastomyces dermatitidis ER-3]EEQ87113.2 hypothetical protein BDCG_02233 [Blastomyces dermatitidis ER-3]